MKQVTSVQRTESEGNIRVTVYERDFSAPVGSAASEATSRVVYEGRDQVAAREAESAASGAMWTPPAAPAPAVEAAAGPTPAFREFVKR